MKLHLLLQKRMETYKKSRKWDLNNFLDEIGENIVYNIDEVVLLTLDRNNPRIKWTKSYFISYSSRFNLSKIHDGKHLLNNSTL